MARGGEKGREVAEWEREREAGGSERGFTREWKLFLLREREKGGEIESSEKQEDGRRRRRKEEGKEELWRERENEGGVQQNFIFGVARERGGEERERDYSLSLSLSLLLVFF